MRKNQVSIKVERFGDQVPQDAGTTHQVISVYADSNNFSAALFEAIHLLMDEVDGHVSFEEVSGSLDIANLGAFTEAVTPQQRLYSARSAAREIEQEIRQMKFELFYAENVEAIVHIISTSEDRDEAVKRLKEELGLNDDFQARKCFDASPVFSTAKEIRGKEQQLIELEERLAIAKSQCDAIEEAG